CTAWDDSLSGGLF
nr:immunoglobulin light chain junction region [Macaca mulatta]